LFFVREESAGVRIWMATRSARRNADGTRVAFGTPRLIRGCVNTIALEIATFVTPDWPAKGSKLFFSRCLPGFCGPGGDFDIFEATWNPAARFRRGDSNASADLDLSDAVHTLLALFQGGGPLPCEDAADSNDDGTVDLSDAVHTLAYLFRGTAVILAPGPETCGPDPTGDAIGCAEYNCP
jgi:hypothetical protein